MMKCSVGKQMNVLSGTYNDFGEMTDWGRIQEKWNWRAWETGVERVRRRTGNCQRKGKEGLYPVSRHNDPP